jgi:hypothetical protein
MNSMLFIENTCFAKREFDAFIREFHIDNNQRQLKQIFFIDMIDSLMSNFYINRFRLDRKD